MPPRHKKPSGAKEGKPRAPDAPYKRRAAAIEGSTRTGKRQSVPKSRVQRFSFQPLFSPYTAKGKANGHSSADNGTKQGPATTPDTANLFIKVAIARGLHLFPFRTEKLNPATPMVLRKWESR